jgi:sugar phosphate isomerase/epimerase
MEVACSTLCFTREPLVAALRLMAELEFGKVDLAIADGSPHISTDALVASPTAIINELKLGPTMAVAAITLRTARHGEALDECVDAAAHMAKQMATPVIVLEAAPTGTHIDDEISRLRRLVRVAARHGATITITTRTGTLAEDPQQCVSLCEHVDGLALTLDPSHFVCGPHQNKPYEEVFAYVQHTHLRDTGRRFDQLQVKVGAGEIEYGKIISSLCKFGYQGALTVAMEDQLAIGDMDVTIEARKLRLLLESYLIQRDSSMFRAA